MHSFEELSQYCTDYMIGALEETRLRVEADLQTSAATNLIKALQIIQLQKAIGVVGVFSMFEAVLQDQLRCADGFRTAGDLLEKAGEVELKCRFLDLQLAINALKHGRGRSYSALASKAADLPFRVKSKNEHFFNEGDVSEIATLVEVDSAFVRRCADMIREVAAVVRRADRSRA